MDSLGSTVVVDPTVFNPIGPGFSGGLIGEGYLPKHPRRAQGYPCAICPLEHGLNGDRRFVVVVLRLHRITFFEQAPVSSGGCTFCCKISVCPLLLLRSICCRQHPRPTRDEQTIPLSPPLSLPPSLSSSSRSESQSIE